MRFEVKFLVLIRHTESDTRIIRGSDLRLQKIRGKYDMRKFYFTNRVVDHWNSLPNWVAGLAANNIVAFKIRLDKHWQHQDIIYGTGSCSEVSRVLI